VNKVPMTGSLVPPAQFGAYVLDTLTVGMYTRHLDAIREYVANARDGTLEAIGAGLLAEKDARIRVVIDEKAKSLSIIDNGIGLSAENAVEVLLRVGMSDKRIGASVGFRGIGRLAGIAYCNTLEFRTSLAGEEIGTSVTFDCSKLREGMSPTVEGDRIEAGSLLSSCAAAGRFEAKKGDHFFEVRLHDIIAAEDVLLNSDELKAYLSQSAPVATDGQKWIYSSVVDNIFKSSKCSIPMMRVILERPSGQIAEVFRPYKGRYKTNKGEPIEIAAIESILPKDGSARYCGWVGISDFPGQIADDTAAGLRIRKQGIGFGDAKIMTDIFRAVSTSNARFNEYLIGEIHILDDQVIPNARRDGFEENDAWLAIRKDLTEHARALSARIRDASEQRNRSADKAKEVAGKAIEVADRLKRTGIASPEQKAKAVEALDKATKKLTGMIGTRATKNGGAEEAERRRKIQSEIERLKKVASQVDAERVGFDQLESAMNRGERKVFRLVLDAVAKVVDQDTYERCIKEITKALQGKKKG